VNSRGRLFWILVVGFFLYLAILSGQRTAPILFMTAGAISLVIKFGFIRPVIAALIPTIILFLIIIIGVDLDTKSERVMLGVVSDYGYKNLVQTGQDESFMGRIEEARDVMKTMRETSNYFELLLGHGHGAVFYPYYSSPEPNIKGDGYVHNIHIGPFLLLYRYGLVGLAGYFIVIYLLIADTRKLSIGKNNSDIHTLRVIFYLAMSIELINFHLRTVLNDPLFSYILCGYIATRILEYNVTSQEVILREATLSYKREGL
jgi:hypothetical protein